MSDEDMGQRFVEADRVRQAEPHELRAAGELVSFAGKSDADHAKELRRRITEALGVVVDILDEASKHRMRIGFQLSPPDAFGRHHVALLEILKEL